MNPNIEASTSEKSLISIQTIGVHKISYMSCVTIYQTMRANPQPPIMSWITLPEVPLRGHVNQERGHSDDTLINPGRKQTGGAMTEYHVPRGGE